jgi:hypothetical protein
MRPRPKPLPGRCRWFDVGVVTILTSCIDRPSRSMLS